MTCKSIVVSWCGCSLSEFGGICAHMCPFWDISDPNLWGLRFRILQSRGRSTWSLTHRGVERDPEASRCWSRSWLAASRWREVSIEVLKRSERERGSKSEGNTERLAAGRRGRQRSLVRLICARAFRSLSNPIPRTHYAHSFRTLRIFLITPRCFMHCRLRATPNSSNISPHTFLLPSSRFFRPESCLTSRPFGHPWLKKFWVLGFLKSWLPLCIEVNFVPTLMPSWPVSLVWVLFDSIALWSRGMHFGVMYWAGRWGGGGWSMSWPQLSCFVSSRLRLSTFALVSWWFRWPLRCAPLTHSNACLEVCGEHYGIRGGHQHFKLRVVFPQRWKG